jgi:hypothetical protein
MPIYLPFGIAYPRLIATIPISQVQRSVLKRDSDGLMVDHLGGVSITHWPKECELRLIINRDGKVRPKFLGRWVNLGFRAKKDDGI